MVNCSLLSTFVRLQVTHCIHTSELESLHSLYTKYVPKRKKFSRDGMEARLRLAAMDHNWAVDREQAKTSDGTLKFKLEYSKPAQTYIVKKVKTQKDWSFRNELLAAITERCCTGTHIRDCCSLGN